MTLSEAPSPPGLSFPACQMRVDPKRQAAAMTGAGRAHAGSAPSRGQGPRGQPGTRGPPAACAQSLAPAWSRDAGRAGGRKSNPGPSLGLGLRAAAGGRRRPPGAGAGAGANSHGGGSGRRTWQQQ